MLQRRGHETIVKQVLEKKNSVDPDLKDVDELDAAIIFCGGAREVKQLLEQNSVDGLGG